jgi:hypothetical protein
MINRATGHVDFRSGLHIAPHCSVQSLVANAIIQPSIATQKLSLTDWNRHILGIHISEHGTFEVEALSAGGDRIQVVLLSHRHGFYEPGTPDDADRRTFHEGLINADLAGQREFSWGEVLCRLERAANKDWLVVAYSHEAKVPLPDREILLHLYAREDVPEDNA